MTTSGHDDSAAHHAGNRPAVPLDPLWNRRWEAAARRQSELRDQDRSTAWDAVAAMVHQIGDLQQHAGWWSDRRLAAQAVDEVIWVTATGEENVGSAPAQRAWAVDPVAGRRAWQEWADRTGG